MRAGLTSSLRRWGAAWLLGWAMLLPVAQALAATHALSHVTATTAPTRGDDAAAGAAPCDLCLAGAALACGGVAAEAPRLTVPCPAGALPAAGSAGAWTVPAGAPYSSRAPPSSSR